MNKTDKNQMENLESQPDWVESTVEMVDIRCNGDNEEPHLAFCNSHITHASTNISPNENYSSQDASLIVNSTFHGVNVDRPASSTTTSTSYPSSVGDETFLPKPGICSAYFEKQPPNNLRKSNFFHFELIFTDELKNPQIIESASFIGFCEKNAEDSQLRNGIMYNIRFGSKNGELNQERILVRLIDSVTKKPISYDGQDKNPDMCRVLLTHEIMCSRCCESKSCGNRNETPSDPVILGNKVTCRFHMKCNQNCLKNAGNPRETRRFQVMIAKIPSSSAGSESSLDKKILAISESMFVHNNSKHGRRPNGSGDSNSDSYAGSRNNIQINFVIPKEGRMTGYEEIAVIGENFYDGLQLVFGNQLSINTEFVNSSLIKAITPCINFVGNVDLKFIYNHKPVSIASTCYFKYRSETLQQLDPYLEKLWVLLPKTPSEFEIPSKDIILKRACEFMELMYSPTSSATTSTASSTSLSMARNSCHQSLSNPSASSQDGNSGIHNSELFLMNGHQNFTNGYTLSNFDDVLKSNMIVNQPQRLASVNNDNIVSQFVNSLPIDANNMMISKNKLYPLRKRNLLVNNNNSGTKFDCHTSKSLDPMYNNQRTKNGLCNSQAVLNNYFNVQSRQDQGVNSSTLAVADQLLLNLNSGMNESTQSQICEVMDGNPYANKSERQFNGIGNLKTQSSFSNDRTLNCLMANTHDGHNFDLKQIVNSYHSENSKCKQTNSGGGVVNQSHSPYNLQSMCVNPNNFAHFTATSKRIQ